MTEYQFLIRTLLFGVSNGSRMCTVCRSLTNGNVCKMISGLHVSANTLNLHVLRIRIHSSHHCHPHNNRYPHCFSPYFGLIFPLFLLQSNLTLYRKTVFWYCVALCEPNKSETNEVFKIQTVSHHYFQHYN